MVDSPPAARARGRHGRAGTTVGRVALFAFGSARLRPSVYDGPSSAYDGSSYGDDGNAPRTMDRRPRTMVRCMETTGMRQVRRSGVSGRGNAEEGKAARQQTRR